MTENSPSPDQCHVFVYGTLKPNEANYDKYCAGQVITQQQAIAYGELFALPMGYPAMTIGNKQVYGYLLTFPDDIILEAMDDLEDYQSDRATSENLSENLYDRQKIETFDLAGSSLGLAWAYLMTKEQVIKFAGIAQTDGWWSNFSGDRPKF
ncbi:gamma-glutamylcyclotransferase [Pseudanabaena sp. ABRG5-3]|uniref:gamma-glutamylcyclotransferase family protein n=1 Tax=Pseudanabaena sp. ABRG5-3 TaxID=685565 RepID=UPI000DC6E86A|nr:gamma-glutamylcyclotransferase [Pseudanabaena sp. ABRG5-3]BBC22786.1 AIG2 family protein [Pseudanabaena sp. ABRG5-3]